MRLDQPTALFRVKRTTDASQYSRRRAAVCALAATAALVASAATPRHHRLCGHSGTRPPSRPPRARAATSATSGPTTTTARSVELDKSPGPGTRPLDRPARLGGRPAVGTTKTWLALNDYSGRLYLKSYTLRGIGDHIQVWVADDRAFPAGDCRNDLGLTEVTDAQVDSFVHEFDTNIYPTESTAFSTPPDRDGAGADPARTDRASRPTTTRSPPTRPTTSSCSSTTCATRTTTTRRRRTARPTSPASSTRCSTSTSTAT